MSTQASDTATRHSIVVEAPIERAFSVFTDGFGTFKPREHNMLQVDIAETVFRRMWAATSTTVASMTASAAGLECSNSSRRTGSYSAGT